jgi:hypothetical protein
MTLPRAAFQALTNDQEAETMVFREVGLEMGPASELRERIGQNRHL